MQLIPLQRSTTDKDLGILFDEKLTFKNIYRKKLIQHI